MRCGNYANYDFCAIWPVAEFFLYLIHSFSFFVCTIQRKIIMRKLVMYTSLVRLWSHLKQRKEDKKTKKKTCFIHRRRHGARERKKNNSTRTKYVNRIVLLMPCAWVNKSAPQQCKHKPQQNCIWENTTKLSFEYLRVYSNDTVCSSLICLAAGAASIARMPRINVAPSRWWCLRRWVFVYMCIMLYVCVLCAVCSVYTIYVYSMETRAFQRGKDCVLQR